MAYTEPDDAVFFSEFINLPEDDDSGASNTPQSVPASISESRPVSDFNSLGAHLDLPQYQDILEPPQRQSEPRTIQPYLLNAPHSYLGENRFPLTSSQDHSQNLQSSSTTRIPNTRARPWPQRPLAPSATRGAIEPHIESRSSSSDASSSTGSPAMVGAGPPTNIHPSTECHCGTKCKTPSELRKHQLYHIRPLKCHLCDYRAAYPRDMKRHMTTNHPHTAAALHVPQSKTICPACSKSFTRKDNWQKHFRKKHRIQGFHARFASD